MIDLHTLILCDYIIGPPSSFGTWISWYGNVPRLIINKDTKIDNLENPLALAIHVKFINKEIRRSIKYSCIRN